MQESLSDKGIVTRPPETPTRLTTSETGITLTPHSNVNVVDRWDATPLRVSMFFYSRFRRIRYENRFIRALYNSVTRI